MSSARMDLKTEVDPNHKTCPLKRKEVLARRTITIEGIRGDLNWRNSEEGGNLVSQTKRSKMSRSSIWRRRRSRRRQSSKITKMKQTLVYLKKISSKRGRIR